MKKISFPVMNVKMVETTKIFANDYNPNKVASVEMQLLQKSIEEDGYTQPIVTFYDAINDKYIIVDGFHRYTVGKKLKLPELPIVVIEKDLAQRMSSTIRHNRARGKHGIEAMADIVIALRNQGWQDKEIAKHLGMEAEELLRLKQQKGMADKYANHIISKSWEEK